MSKKYFVLHPAKFRLDGGAMFGIIPKPLWEKCSPPDEQNRIDMALRVFLIKTEKKVILIDTGIGDYHGDRFETRFDVRTKKNPLVSLLKNNFNLNPEDVTDIILSHLHFDHAGGLGDSSNPLFVNATIHLHLRHFDYAKNSNIRDSGSFHKEYFLPLIDFYQKKNQLHFLDDLEGNILLDINYKCSFGHTPYMMHAYDDKFIYMADLVPTYGHIKLPWVMGYDMNPGISTTDKKSFYEFIIKNKLTMIFEHDPINWGATIKTDKADFNYEDLYPASNFECLEVFNK